MKRIVIISLMLITAMIIGTGLAYASISSFGTNVGSWSQTNGNLIVSGGSIVSDPGFKSIIGREAGSVTTDASGNFDATFTFRVVNLSSDVFVGVSDRLDDSNDILVGYSKDHQAFIVTKNQQSVLTTLGSNVNPSSSYSAEIKSTDGGKSFTCSISGVGSYPYPSGFKPQYVAVVIFNNGVDNGPQVSGVGFTSTGATPSVSPSPSPSPGVNSTSVATGIDHSDMQNWYANYYEPPVLSNQSLIYDQSGHIAKVVTGKPGQATIMPISGATITPTPIPTTVPASNVTAPLNVATNTTATISPVVATATPTKSQSPGFGIILVAIGMLAAIFFVSRKK